MVVGTVGFEGLVVGGAAAVVVGIGFDGFVGMGFGGLVGGLGGLVGAAGVVGGGQKLGGIHFPSAVRTRPFKQMQPEKHSTKRHSVSVGFGLSQVGKHGLPQSS